MEKNIFVIGETQEQVESQKFNSEPNKLVYEVIRGYLYDNSLSQGMKLNVYTDLSTGIGIATAIATISLKNEFDTFNSNITLNLVNSSETYNFNNAKIMDELITFADSVKTRDTKLSSYKYIIDKSDMGIISWPTIKDKTILESLKYGVFQNKQISKLSGLKLEEVTVIDTMM